MVKILGVQILILSYSCVANPDFEIPLLDCGEGTGANLDFQGLDSLYQGETLQILDDFVLEGYVVSSDIASNFFGVLIIQDKLENPTQGLRFEMDQSQSHLQFPPGTKILIKLNGLYLGKTKDEYKLGGTFSSFGNISVGRLPSLKVKDHLFSACAEEKAMPTSTTISQLGQLPLNTLIKLENMEFLNEELGETFAVKQEETIRMLQDCDENQVELVTSGYADFQAEPLPEGRGSITGVLVKDGDDYQLMIRSLGDIDFTEERCPEIITEFTSNKVFISELADPDNNSSARFVELYNAGDSPLDLNLWTLRRYTNDNMEIGSEVDLSGNIIEANGTLVVSPNAEEFEMVYGFPPDLGISTNSPADSNGDDNLELVDPFGKVIDAFGMVGEDGSGTNHEFEDGRAVRNPDIIEANPVYTFMEWTVFNDTGDSGTTKQPQNAPEDFSPKEHK